MHYFIKSFTAFYQFANIHSHNFGKFKIVKPYNPNFSYKIGEIGKFSKSRQKSKKSRKKIL